MLSSAGPAPQTLWSSVLPVTAATTTTSPSKSFLLAVCYACPASASPAHESTGSSGDDLVDFFVFQQDSATHAIAVLVAADACSVASLTPTGMATAVYRRLIEDALAHRSHAGESSNSASERSTAAPVDVVGSSASHAAVTQTLESVELRLRLASPTAASSSHGSSSSSSGAHFVLARVKLMPEEQTRSSAKRRAACLHGVDSVFSFAFQLFGQHAHSLHTARAELAAAHLSTQLLRHQLETLTENAIHESGEDWLASMVAILNEKTHKVRQLTEEVVRLKRSAAAATAARADTAASATRSSAAASRTTVKRGHRSTSKSEPSARLVKTEQQSSAFASGFTDSSSETDDERVNTATVSRPSPRSRARGKVKREPPSSSSSSTTSTDASTTTSATASNADSDTEDEAGKKKHLPRRGLPAAAPPAVAPLSSQLSTVGTPADNPPPLASKSSWLDDLFEV